MEFFLSNISIIMFLPLWVCLLIIFHSLVIPFVSKKFTTVLTLASTGIGLVFSLVMMTMFAKYSYPALEGNVVWFDSGDFVFYLGVLLDKISSLFLLILMSVSFVVQLYSYGYMKNDENFNKYYFYLNLFNFSMIGLILSSNLIQIYLFWELVGLSSYLLIGFWYKKYSASKAAQKAFIVNRIGDCAFLAAIMSIMYFILNYFEGDISSFIQFSNIQAMAEQIYALTTPSVFYLICLGLFLGAVAKSAQFPLHVWLADAMEAPTPVSALIHAATMVAAGIFLVVRLYPVFIMSPAIMDTILYVGLFTAIITAFFAIFQTDIKRMLAYSTSSQLGLMFIALGLFAPSAALFHLTTHAFYKALLFLSAGAVIKYMNHIQDIRYMGALRKKLPVVAICYLIGAVSLSGFCFSGFYSKESIMNAVLAKDSVVLLTSFLLVSFFTSFYIFKSYFVVFEGDSKSELYKENKIPESMNISIILLAVPSVIIGAVLNSNFESFINPGSLNIPQHDNLGVILSTAVTLFAFLLVYLLFKLGKIFTFAPEYIEKLSYNAFYINEFYAFIVNRIFKNLCKLQAFIDKYIVDGLVRFTALFTRFMSWVVSKLQNGNFQTYISYSVFFVGLMFLSILGFYFWLLRG